MQNFDKKSLLELRKMTLDEIKKYQLELRKYEFENEIPLKNIKLRKGIHVLLLQLIKIDRLLAKEKIEVIGDKRIKSDRPKIYACTHIGGNDIQRVFEGIKEHAYLFLGDPQETYIDFNGILLKMNGIIPLETDVKEDRNISYNRAVELLKNDGNLLIFPEGTWNLTDNLPVLKLFNGAAKMSRVAKADIIPVAIEQYDNKFYINIGENIVPSENRNLYLDSYNDLIRDSMATLKWEIWEKIGESSRKNLQDNYGEEFLKTIVDRCEYDFTLEKMLRDAYKDRDTVTPDEAYIVSPKEMYEKRKKLNRDYK